MRIRWSSRVASHLLVVAIVATLLFLGWRMSPDASWVPGLKTEPLFEADQLPSLRGVINQPEVEVTEPVKPVSGPEESRKEADSGPAPAPTPERVQAPARDHEAEALYESWSRARKLLRQRDLAGAERAYRDLTERWPKHPDLLGELGNVYVLLGEKEAARVAFRRAQGLLRPMGSSPQLDAVTRWLERYP